MTPPIGPYLTNHYQGSTSSDVPPPPGRIQKIFKSVKLENQTAIDSRTSSNASLEAATSGLKKLTLTVNSGS